MRRFAHAIIASLGILSACGSPTAPKISYAGDWSGVTSQGEAIGFTVSAEVVTKITIGYAFNGCRGSKEFTGLSQSIVPQVICIDACPGSVDSYRAFSYQSGNSLQEPTTAVNGFFLSSGNAAQGSASFRNYDSCGTATGVSWSATKR